MHKEKSCGIIVFRKEDDAIKYLILHYPQGHWDFPKGHVEKGETQTETALRELKEETGIYDAKIMKNFRHKIGYYFKDETTTTIYKEVTFFLAKTETSDVRLSSEHIGYAWLAFENADRKLTFRNAKELLAKAEKLIKKQKT